MIIADLLLSYFTSFCQVSGSSLEGWLTMGVDHPEKYGLYLPDALVSQ